MDGRWQGAILGICLWATGAAADGPRPDVHRALGDVINAGADLFNLQADYAGCYQLYRGSLLTLRPTLTGEQDRRIDQALKRADGMSNFADRAYCLREAIDRLRDQLKSQPAAEEESEAPGELILVAPIRVKD